MATSHPSRVRGLKFYLPVYSVLSFFVAPFTGAWIEIWNGLSFNINDGTVAPFTGAWIEIIIRFPERRAI